MNTSPFAYFFNEDGSVCEFDFCLRDHLGKLRYSIEFGDDDAFYQ
jgi:hypothetical protein